MIISIDRLPAYHGLYLGSGIAVGALGGCLKQYIVACYQLLDDMSTTVLVMGQRRLRSPDIGINGCDTCTDGYIIEGDALHAHRDLVWPKLMNIPDEHGSESSGGDNINPFKLIGGVASRPMADTCSAVSTTALLLANLPIDLLNSPFLRHNLFFQVTLTVLKINFKYMLRSVIAAAVISILFFSCNQLMTVPLMS